VCRKTKLSGRSRQSAQDLKTQRCRLGGGDRSRAIWLQAASLHRDDLNAVAHEGVELGKAIAAGAVAEQDPDFRVWAAQRGTKREAGTDAERAERSGIEPTARSARPHDVARRGDTPPSATKTASAANNAVTSSRTSTTQMPRALAPARMGEICPPHR
jgi:hypothetical protein